MTTIRLGDLEQTVTIGDVIDAMDQQVAETRDLVIALIEHWTDDEGLHLTPFLKELQSSLEERSDNIAKELIK